MKPRLLSCFALAVAAVALLGQETTPKVFPMPNGRQWPEKVGLAELPIVKASTNTPGTKLPSGKTWHAYETDHFQMLCDQPLAPSALRELGRLLEATWELNCRLPLNWEPTVPQGQKHYTIRLFSQTSDYHAANGPKGTGGVYLADKKEVLLPAKSLGADGTGSELKVKRQTEDQGTLVHEVTHLMMHAWLPNLPFWLAEGSAEYVSAADYSAGNFRMKHHLRHVRLRLEKLLSQEAKDKKRLSAIPLGQLLHLSPKQWRERLAKGDSARLYGTALCLTTYFYHGDTPNAAEMPIFSFVDAVRRGQPFPKPLATYLLRDRTAADLENAVRQFWQENGVKISFSPEPEAASSAE